MVVEESKDPRIRHSTPDPTKTPAKTLIGPTLFLHTTMAAISTATGNHQATIPAQKQ